MNVIVYPRKGQSPEDPELLESAELRCNKLVNHIDGILASGILKIRAAIGRFYPETKQLPDADLLQGLQLRYVKLSSVNELIFECNAHYHGLDLNLIVQSSPLGVKKAWMDG